MPNLSIKDVPAPLAEKLHARAARNHRSLQGELMAILENAAEESDLPPGASVQGHLGVYQLMQKVAEYKIETPDESTAIVRAMRDGKALNEPAQTKKKTASTKTQTRARRTV